MKRLIFFFTLLSLFNLYANAQSALKHKDSLFTFGISFVKPNYQFKWKIIDNVLPDESILGIKISKRKRKLITVLEFDSALFLNDISFDHVIVGYRSKENEKGYKMLELSAFVNKENLEKLTFFFNYNWNNQGWIYYPREKPIYHFKLYKTKYGGAIGIYSDRK